MTKISDVYKTLSKQSKWVAIKGVALVIFSRIYWWVYMNIIQKVISFFINLWFVIIALFQGMLFEAISIRNKIKKGLKNNNDLFISYYYQYASYSGYDVDDYINVYGKIYKNPFKDWNNWFITSVLRGFKGDCDDYASITSTLAKWSNIKHSKYITTIMTYDAKNVKFENVAHAIVVIDKNVKDKSIKGKVLTWGNVYTVKDYNNIYLKYSKSNNKKIVLYFKY